MKKFGQKCKARPEHIARAGGMVTESYEYKFPNGWGASVIRGAVSMGDWELAVIGRDGHLNYDHPVSRGDVVRGEEEEIAEWLRLIKETPADPGISFKNGEVVLEGELVRKEIKP